MSFASASNHKCALDYKHPESEGQKYALYIDDDRRWVHPSPDLCTLLEYSASELIGITSEKLFPPGVQWNEQLYKDFLAKGRLRTFILLQTKSGTIVGLLADSRRLRDGCILAVFTPYP
jgi:hypothetical protein